jgi:hypothetical protein
MTSALYDTEPNYGLLKKALRKHLDTYHFDFFITANFNRETGFESGRKLLNKWHLKVDRKLFGKYWWRMKAEDRTFFFAFPEIGGKSGGFHYHLLLKLPANRKEEFSTIGPEIWKQLVPSGDLDIQRPIEEISQKKTKSYSIKDVWQKLNYENFIVSTEFSERQYC